MAKKAIIIPTSGMNYSFQRGKYIPDLHSHIRLAAGIELYKKYANSIDPYLVLSGGRTQGAKTPCLADNLAEMAEHKYKIHSSKILLEELSIDTSENAEFSRDLCLEKGIEEAVVVTNNYQLKRALECFKYYNSRDKTQFKVDGLSAEEVLKQKSKSYSNKASELLDENRVLLKLSPDSEAAKKVYRKYESLTRKSNSYSNIAEDFLENNLSLNLLNLALRFGMFLHKGNPEFIREHIHNKILKNGRR